MGWVEIISVVFGLLGIPQLWGSNWKEIWYYYYKGILSYDIVHKSILKIIEQLRKESFQANLIIGLGRGGILCAGILCSELTGEDLVKSTIEKKEEKHSTHIKLGTINTVIIVKNPSAARKGEENGLSSAVENIELTEINANVERNDKILLVTAQNFSGNSLFDALQKIITEKGVNRDNIKTIAIFWHKHKNLKVVHTPDIWGKIISIKKTMPWKSYKVTTDRY